MSLATISPEFPRLFRPLTCSNYLSFCFSDREPLVRIELTTSSLPRKCSTTELQRLFHCRRRQSSKWSGRPGSNRPPEAWKATALPNELLPLVIIQNKELKVFSLVSFKTRLKKKSGQSWVRTNVLVREQIYSLSPLTTRPSAHVILIRWRLPKYSGQAIRPKEPKTGVEPATY
jgi:hypothetical protein